MKSKEYKSSTVYHKILLLNWLLNKLGFRDIPLED